MSNWELTQQILQNASGPIIKKPLLTDKYLTKPPFRFLHDVITAVQKETGFAPGLYNDAELDAKGIQDKESKVAYLAKIMDVVGIVLNEPVPAKPLKVVAGLEPESTNIFLQMLGKACRMDATKAVQKVLAALGGDAGAARPSSRPSSQQEPEAAAPPVKASSKVRSSKDEKPAAAAEKPAAEKPAKEKSSSKKEPPKEEPPPPVKELPKEEKKKEKKPEKEKVKEPEPVLAKQDSSLLAKAAAPPKSKAKAEDPPAEEAPAEAPKFNRPQSARKAPPKLPASNVAVPAASRPLRKGPAGAAPPERPGTSGGRPGAPPVQVYEENSKAAADDDDEVEVVTEQAPAAFGRNVAASGEQGVLVRNILEAERSLKKAGEEAAAPTDEEAGGKGIVLSRRRGAAAPPGGGSKADAGAVRELVQKLVQSSHPLAKSMDYLQEDLDNMAKEHRFWVTERRVYQDKLLEEQRHVTDTTQISAQLADQDGQIRQAKDRILGLKAQVLRNEETVAKLLGMVTGGR